MIREVILSKHQVADLLNELERIEDIDGRPGFCRKELEEARDLLTSEIAGELGMTKKLIENRQSITAEPLKKFLSLLRKTRKEFSEFKDVCKELGKMDRPSCEQDPFPLECLPSLGEKACEALFYSLELIIYEDGNTFEMAIREPSDTIAYEIINSILDQVTIEEWNGLFPSNLHLDPRPMDSLPDSLFPPKSGSIKPMPIPRFPERTEKIETFPPGDYPSITVDPWYSPDVHEVDVWELLFSDTIKS